jgi:hypothetical protein
MLAWPGLFGCNYIEQILLRRHCIRIDGCALVIKGQHRSTYTLTSNWLAHVLTEASTTRLEWTLDGRLQGLENHPLKQVSGETGLRPVQIHGWIYMSPEILVLTLSMLMPRALTRTVQEPNGRHLLHHVQGMYHFGGFPPTRGGRGIEWIS